MDQLFYALNLTPSVPQPPPPQWLSRKLGKAATAPEIRTRVPNLIITSMYQAAWWKLFTYLEIEPRFLSARLFGDGDGDKGRGCTLRGKALEDEIASLVDQNTIGVVGVLGNHCEFRGSRKFTSQLKEISEGAANLFTHHRHGQLR